MREKLAELHWLENRDTCHYPGYLVKDWATLVEQVDSELGQRYVVISYDAADQPIAIFEEMLDTMELPEVPLWATFENIGVPGADSVYRVAQQDLLKALKKECDKE